VINAALAKVEALDPRTLDDILIGCAEPRDEQGGNVARRIAVCRSLAVTTSYSSHSVQ